MPALKGPVGADVVIVGAGFTGLWTAHHLLDADPSVRVVVLEQAHVGFGASGRNGGFCEASLTHGLRNGLRHFSDEIGILEREAQLNFTEFLSFIRTNSIDCDLELTGRLVFGDQAHHIDEFHEEAHVAARHGINLQVLDGPAAQAEVNSPRWTAALEMGPDRSVMLHPAKLANGLARLAVARGVQIFENARVSNIEKRRDGVRVVANGGTLDARKVVVATSAYSGWIRRLQMWFVPVYDYALVSRPLSKEELHQLGWRRRQPALEANNQFHYFRLTPDNRILWAGYDAIYHFGNRVSPELDFRDATARRLRQSFVKTFPYLVDLPFEYAWGGPIDTTTRFTVTFGRLLSGRGAYALGYTGHGVAASRWAAKILRDLTLEQDSDLLRLRFVRSKPIPFPPEPVRYLGVQLMRRELDRADRNQGRRSLLLRVLDRMGIGFDS
jgi:glycine/D-amino acid oxidase-like deaminating enzyme